MRAIQRKRNTEAERQNRRRKRAHKLALAHKLPEIIKGNLMLRGLARSEDSVRGLLLEAVLSGAAQDPSGEWIFDGSVRDLAEEGGLADGQQHSLRYLLACMQMFVAAGILKPVYARKGRPVVYAIRAE
ncbi:hypothetical protein [Acidithiobacillus ferriphilus]|uniref:hypothetical protein n=1 Tax=Acidithiobacillus ferriphilus TaxID=1689834 RepID=UPI001C07E79B|nr:hypothetical protein [Acidithiobacillus ferriphilus]MBU2831890.1 hypothetical protein [Acidithiobacillus ferriphilus]